ncbi:MAG: oligosaccharide flippase family protein [Acidobacteriia bacterium]|nr:oligosaccharide flippase family protein [Terriglobia bacterium]
MNETPPLTSELQATRVASAFGWNITGAGIKAGAAFAINIALARLLGPKPFGIVALALPVISLGSLLVDSGLGISLIQKPTVTKEDVRAVFTMQMLVGAGLVCLLAIIAPVAAATFRLPELTSVLRLLSLMLILQAAGQTSTALLKRRLAFKQIQKAQIASYVIGYGFLGLPMAFFGYGVWSLVAAQLVQSACLSFTVYAMTRHPLGFGWSSSGGSLARFGIWVVATNCICWCIGNLPTFAIGRLFGVAELGLYNRAFTLVAIPMSAIVGAAQPICLSIYSRLQNDRLGLDRAHQAALALLLTATLPVCLTAALVSHTIIAGLFGPQWRLAGALLAPLALAVPFDNLASLASPILQAKGRPGLEFKGQMLTVLFALLTLALMRSSHSVVAVSWAMCLGVYGARCCILTVTSLSLLGIPWHRFAVICRNAALLASVAACITFLADQALIVSNIAAGVRLPAIILIAAAATLSLVYICPRFLLGAEVFELALDNMASLPAVLRCRVRGYRTVHVAASVCSDGLNRVL